MAQLFNLPTVSSIQSHYPASLSSFSSIADCTILRA
uniref:Uncharacterized protein n=1 Tax=Siphoviridae sp. ct2wG4 TaxID=2826278 RepID=A0A8S5QW29_9CAUD|nr:MAG TPA: hypothetical protein [Siphoviridae sp. ct2wG4]DAU49704.1 MAG TPA: hypothetical protein [Caudoviricetes sp.]